ncbi:MAG: hypothetical protein JOY96_00040 [Verrucomicrobia bacterium]|nr:hypothetical protein [Verrucomicrobiota bacterium]MBV9671514.1 hypothetical protein [Verrucomicrobiota bacterium]
MSTSFGDMVQPFYNTRTRLISLFVFIALISVGRTFAQAPSSGASAPGWGPVWQQRMTIGQAQLDDAFKLAAKGEVAQALAIIDQVIATDPQNWRSYFLKSAVLTLARRGDEALRQLDISINLARKSFVKPALLAELYESKARSCIDYGKYDEARKSLDSAVRLQPENPTTLNDLAWLLATSKASKVRDGRRAVSLAMKACRLEGWKNAFAIDTLAAASAAAGNFSDAVKYQQLAISKLGPDDRKAQLGGMQSRLQGYTSGQAYVGI